MKKGKKRKIGERAIGLLDSIDLQILEVLEEKCNEGIGIMELRQVIGIHHTSLKPHLDKLISCGLIISARVSGTNKISLEVVYPDKKNNPIFTIKKPTIDSLRAVKEYYQKGNSLSKEEKTVLLREFIKSGVKNVLNKELESPNILKKK